MVLLILLGFYFGFAFHFVYFCFYHFFVSVFDFVNWVRTVVRRYCAVFI